MTVLCLVELDGAGAADASLRALSFGRSLAVPAASPDVAGPDVAGPAVAGPDVAGTGPVGVGAAGVGSAGAGSAGVGSAGAGSAGAGSAGTNPAAGGLAAVLFADAAALASEAPAGAALADYGVSEAYVVEPGQLAGYAPLAWARVLAGLISQTGASAVLAAGTDRGSEVMAHLGALTGAPMAANCVSATASGTGPSGTGSWRIVRQRWAGLLLEDAVLEASPALMTVATDAVAATPAASPAPLTVRLHQPELADGDLAVRATESAERSAGISLATARVVVGGGRGVGGPEGFAPLEELARLLGGVVGVSRVVTSEGWRPHKQQVGQTGTKITPELYLACGISGAIQHIAGCASAKHIIAVNSDAGAPILGVAEYAVIGDLHEVIPALVAAIAARGVHPDPKGAGGQHDPLTPGPS